MFVEKRKKNNLFYFLVAVSFLIVISLTAWFVWHDVFNAHQDHNLDVNSQSNSNHNQRYFIMSSKVLNEMVTNQKVFNNLKNDTIYVLLSSKNPLSSQSKKLHLVLTAYYTSEAALKLAVDNHTINSTAKAIVYDNEPWIYTPKVEQQDPSLYYQEASTISRQNGYIFIATPVIKNKSDNLFFSSVAKESDVLDIQSQYDQAVSSVYANHVIPLAKIAQQANPKLIILSGLSTNPAAGVPTITQLLADAQAVQKYVKGYWLNIPATPAFCKTHTTSSHHTYNGRCAGPQPQLGIKFLEELKTS